MRKWSTVQHSTSFDCISKKSYNNSSMPPMHIHSIYILTVSLLNYVLPVLTAVGQLQHPSCKGQTRQQTAGWLANCTQSLRFLLQTAPYTAVTHMITVLEQWIHDPRAVYVRIYMLIELVQDFAVPMLWSHERQYIVWTVQLSYIIPNLCTSF